jgi:hypothetical protein
MILLSNEEEILSSNGRKIILTNQRIHMSDKEWGSSIGITIFLEDISSIEMRFSSQKLFLALSIIAALVSYMTYSDGNENAAVGGSLVAAILFFLLYWFTRRHIVSITSHAGTSLKFDASSLPEYEMLKFLSKVQEAKLQRVNKLGKFM